MKVLFNNIFNNYKNYNNSVKCTNLAPLKCDTVSFCANNKTNLQKLFEQKINEEDAKIYSDAFERLKKTVFQDFEDEELASIFEKCGYNFDKLLEIIKNRLTIEAGILSYAIDIGLISEDDLRIIIDSKKSKNPYLTTLLDKTSTLYPTALLLIEDRAQETELDNPVINLFKAGFGFETAYIFKNQFNNDDIKEINGVLKKIDLKSSFRELQNQKGYEIIAQRQEKSPRKDIDIRKTLSITNPLGIKKSTALIKKTSVDNWYNGSNHEFQLEFNPKTGNLVSQLEIVSDVFGPSYALYTKESEVLKGAFETSVYNFGKYPDETDVIKGIKQNSINPDAKLSTVTQNPDGTITYQENFSCNDCTTQRNYSILKDKHGNPQQVRYIYQITDDNGQQLLSLDKFFKRISDNTTKTVINGEEYIAKFHPSMKIEIEKPDGTKQTIDIKSKLKRAYGNNEEMIRKIFEFFKTLPADLLLNINNYVKHIKLAKDSKSSYYMGAIETSNNIATISHETGHAIDFGQYDLHKLPPISKNQELIDTYTNEMFEFKDKYPEFCQDIIRYFSLDGGGDYDFGINEFVAESYVLLNIYGDTSEEFSARSQFLARYFPKSIACVAKLINKIPR